MKAPTILDIKNREYQRCIKCIMDTSAPTIKFDGKGVCNYCKEQKVKVNKLLKKKSISKLIKEIEDRAKERKYDYDAILGISGGIDSSYVAYLLKKFDLDILLIHIDDGWNTKIAKHNVSVIVEQTGWDYKHIILNSEEYHDIIRAFIKAKVTSLEMITDNLCRAQIYKMAKENNTKNIISGDNVTSEGILPKCWGHDNNDSKNIKDIHSKYGTIKIQNLEFLNGTQRILKKTFRGYKEYDPLNHLENPYNRLIAQDELEEYWAWQKYGPKHYENRYTRFLESYIFPTKIGFDKRIAHYSSLIGANQISRQEALEIVKKDSYAKNLFKREFEFFLSKLNLSKEEFNEYMNSELHLNSEYATHELRLKIYRIMSKIIPIL